MTSLFEKRERAAEGLFVHSEETRFLVRRHAVEALAAWAAESMGLDANGRAAYAQRLVDQFVSGTPEDQLLPMVGTDLERAGKSDLAGQTGAVLARASAEAASAANGKPKLAVEPKAQDPHEEFARRHPQSHPWTL